MSAGSILYEIGPAPGSPRSSEGAFLSTKRGLMFAYTAFIGDTARDHTQADISVMFSTDGGRSFTPPRVVIKAAEHHAQNVMSVSLLRLKHGQIALFFLLRRSFFDLQPYMAVSDDEGLSFHSLKPCASRTSYLVMNNDRVLRLPTGRILLPLAEHVALAPSDAVPDFHPGTLTFLYSDDEGQSFHESRTPLFLDSPYTKSGLQEPGCLSLGDHLVYAWARTDRGYQYESFSRDGGITWSSARASQFTSPLSPLSMKRLPDGRLFAVWNPIPSYQTRAISPYTGGRTPLVYAVSDDEGFSWSEPVTIEGNPHSGYCYCAIHVEDDAVILAYCAGSEGEDKGCLNRLRMRRIPYREMTFSKFQPSPEGSMGIGIIDYQEKENSGR